MSQNSYSQKLKEEYQLLFDTCIIASARYVVLDKIVSKMLSGQSRYQFVGLPLSLPWYAIGILHYMESSCNFSTHLHNGDPLTAKTIHVPKGRPTSGHPPYSWEVSARDALILKNLDQWSDWSIPGLLYTFENYNGFGYRRLKSPIRTPYLWSFSNHYTKGKYVADGIYDSNAVSLQCGAAVILKYLVNKQIIQPHRSLNET
jgi:lysozyme family protein